VKAPPPAERDGVPDEEDGRGQAALALALAVALALALALVLVLVAGIWDCCWCLGPLELEPLCDDVILATFC